jgi:hypothetical protein
MVVLDNVNGTLARYRWDADKDRRKRPVNSTS